MSTVITTLDHISSVWQVTAKEAVFFFCSDGTVQFLCMYYNTITDTIELKVAFSAKPSTNL